MDSIGTYVRALAQQAIRSCRAWPRLVVRRHPYVARIYASRRLGYALIGCGDIGYRDAAALAHSVNSRLVGVYDVDQRLADDVAARYKTTVYAQYEEALRDEQVEVVLVALPHHLHAEFAIRALEHGRHVVVEKPLARTLEEGERMVEAERRSGRQLAVCFPQRYTLASQLARELIQSGALGAVTGVTISCRLRRDPAYWRGGFSGRSSSDWRMRRSLAGGGVLLMNGVHQLDLAMWLLGATIEDIHGVVHNAVPQMKDVEDDVRLTFRMGTGITGSLEATTAWPLAPTEQLDVIGEHGVLRLGDALELACRAPIRPYQPGRPYRFLERPPSNERTIFFNEISEALLHNRPVPVSSQQALAVQRIIAEAYTQAGWTPSQGTNDAPAVHTATGTRWSEPSA